ncbi:hypothetical protein [Inconstantimicrobium mannanitabidum]|uniref:Uncharacterized protein n=1 Tax=Inconstantimicrobium mannanitabidum TaxID=1604901 RepID=A0ACB5RIQ6_9CLOT|nr:hypothetical protein [Clostridium sp. TW13]GKX68969.1 hypothetical protein rsdtw13_42270 [Clostridium sp. TW13]
MNKKKIIPILVLMCVFLGGCSNSNDVKDASSKTNTSQNSDTTSKDQTANDNTDNNSTAGNSDSNQQTTKENNSNSNQQPTKNDSGSKNNEIRPSFYGTWTISKKLASNKVTTFTDEDLNKIIGKTVIFSKEQSISFAENVSDLNNIITNPIYQKKTVSNDTIASETRNHVTLDKLGIKGNSVTEVEVINSKKYTGCSFYIKDKNTLILSGGGVYLQLNRK